MCLQTALPSGAFSWLFVEVGRLWVPGCLWIQHKGAGVERKQETDCGQSRYKAAHQRNKTDFTSCFSVVVFLRTNEDVHTPARPHEERLYVQDEALMCNFGLPCSCELHGKENILSRFPLYPLLQLVKKKKNSVRQQPVKWPLKS